jgi:hypothetical protein
MQLPIKLIACLLTACIINEICIAQNQNQNSENNYRAVHWGLDECLSQYEVYFMLKDVNGFLWIHCNLREHYTI